MFQEGKDKDYFYMRRSDLPLIPTMGSEITLTEKPPKHYRGGKLILIFTFSGAVKFNFRKRKESSIMTADALVERDRDFIMEERRKLKEDQDLLKNQLNKLGDIKEIKQLINIDYKNTIQVIPIEPNYKFIDFLGNKYESKGEVNISNAMIVIEWTTGVKLEFYHPDIVKFSDVEIDREDFMRMITEDIIKKANWEGTRFPWGFQPDWGFKKFPNIKGEFYGGWDDQYEARRKIKELFYKLCGFTILRIEKNEDANFPYLINKIIKALHLRKRKAFRTKL